MFSCARGFIPKLEEAKRFAEAAKRARKIAADDRQGQAKRA
jgi:hypothetical protein